MPQLICPEYTGNEEDYSGTGYTSSVQYFEIVQDDIMENYSPPIQFDITYPDLSDEELISAARQLFSSLDDDEQFDSNTR